MKLTGKKINFKRGGGWGGYREVGAGFSLRKGGDISQPKGCAYLYKGSLDYELESIIV